MKLVDQSNPYILEQTWEWNFLKVHNLLNIKWIRDHSSITSAKMWVVGSENYNFC